MEEYTNKPVDGLHLLQHTLRSLCDENSLWIYAVFWRLLPRNHPPPTWDFHQRGAHNKQIRENRTNWMLAWEDGFYNFFASTAESNPQGSSSSSAGKNSDIQHLNGLQPQLFFKMSHEIHNYGEGLVGKVAADRGHKYVHDSEQTSGDQLHPKTWGPQFRSGIKTIALIAVEEGVLQLGAVRKVPEDLSYVVQVQKKFSHLLNIPGFLLPRPSLSSWRIHSRFWFPLTTSINVTQNLYKIEEFNDDQPPQCCSSSSWPRGHFQYSGYNLITPLTTMDHFCSQEPLTTIIPSMSSLDKLLCKLPSVVPAASSPSPWFHESPPNWFSSSQKPRIGIGNIVDEDHSMQTVRLPLEEN